MVAGLKWGGTLNELNGDTLNNRTVLVGDSDEMVRVSVSEYLRDCGYRVLESANSDEVLEVLRNADIRVDVALLDADVAVHGFWLANWIGRHMPQIKVIVATGVDDVAHEAKTLCEHGPLMNKPYDTAELVERINRLLGDGD
jgi:DNA-binding response OmpR family regulator